MKSQKVLIIKTGYTEILEGIKDSRITSLGDVLRTTAILHKYPNSQITWLTSDEAIPLLTENPHINRLLTLDFITAMQLRKEEYDKVINFEKVPGICVLADEIRARKSHYGFTFNSQTGEAEPLERGEEVHAVSFDPERKKQNQRTFQELMFEMVGEKFNSEELILGYKPRTEIKYDLGFNTLAGTKWPTKQWSFENWDKLEKLIGNTFSITRQDEINEEGKRVNRFEGLYNYMDWINSCRTVVSNDSLGLHLALALKKNVVGLFGPTSNLEVCFYNLGEAIMPNEKQECLPCYKPKCSRGESCIDDISPEKVYEAIGRNYKR
ncbi:MAG: glycosyltransferase family 9 protein [archaeon]|nr:glycosyltransferase family 9 protein [archaeon]